MKIISEPKVKTQMTRWEPRESIRNRVGFQIVAKLNNGLLFQTSVKLDADGLHVLDGVKISDVFGWRKATAEEIALKPQ